MSDLGYINGVIKSKSTELLDLKQVEQLNNLSKDVLSTTLESMQIFRKDMTKDDAFLKDEIDLKDFLTSLFTEKHLIFQMFYLTEDHRVLSNVFKKELLGLEVEVDNQLSNFKSNDVYDWLENDADVKKLYESLKDKSSKEISDATYKFLQEKIFAASKKSKDIAFLEYFKKFTDMQNLILYFRSRVFNLNIETFYTYFLEGGRLSKSTFEEMDKVDIKEAFVILGRTYKTSSFKSIEKLGKHDFLAVLCIDLEQDLLDIIESLSYNLDGLSPTIEYILRRRHIMRSIKEIYYKKEREING